MRYVIVCRHFAEWAVGQCPLRIRALAPSHILWRREFQAFLLSSGLSSLGGSMASVAHPWIALQLTGSPAWVGVIFGLPAIIALGPTFLGGVLADRFSKRDVLVVTRVLIAIIALLLALLSVQNDLSIWTLFALIIFGRSFSAIGFPAGSTLVAEIVPEGSLTSANAARNIVGESTEIIGAGISGVVLAVAGTTAAFMMMFLVYAFSAFAMLFVKKQSSTQLDDNESSNPGYRDALVHMKRNRLLQLLFVLVFVDMFTVVVFPLLPIYADEVLNSGQAGFGILLAALSAGGVAGAAILLRAGDSLHAPKLIVIGNVGWGAGMAGIALSEHFVITIAIIVVMGAFGAVTGVAWSSLALNAMPPEMRGRLFSLFNIGFQAFFIGAIAAGFIASTFGLSAAMWIGAAGSAVLPLIVWFASPTFREAAVDA